MKNRQSRTATTPQVALLGAIVCAGNMMGCDTDLLTALDEATGTRAGGTGPTIIITGIPTPSATGGDSGVAPGAGGSSESTPPDSGVGGGMATPGTTGGDSGVATVTGGSSESTPPNFGVGGGGTFGTTGGVAATATGGSSETSTSGGGGSGNSTATTGGSSDGWAPSNSGGSGSGVDDGTTNPIPADAPPRVDNPYEGVSGYVNPEWSAKAAAEPGGERIANTPTGVWLDRIAAIEGTANSQSNGPMGLADHLDAALEQGAGYIQFVIYNLPGRDCAALASNGELGADELPRYKAEYIDPIAAIQRDPKYLQLRIINIVEIDSLPNLITNLNVEQCAQMKSNRGYVEGVAYALERLGALPNVYNYIDAGHHGWLGWDDNFGPSAALFAEVGQLAGFDTVTGFITNTANYSVLEEPYFDINDTVGGTSVRESSWVDWNQYVDERSFAQAYRQELISRGFRSDIGMLIDTSRNGWGGSERPTGPSTSADVDTYVDESRVDRRIHAGNWCNQSGAGLGERPRVAPASGIDAYVWIKPPGESDGSSELIPNDDGKGFDQMCDPAYGGNDRNGNSQSGALPNAPISGAWFSAQFQELMANASPPL